MYLELKRLSLIKKLAGETAIYGIGQILPRILHYIVFSTYLTYRLNESRIEYAIYTDLYAYASVLIVIFSLRLDTSFFRFASRDYPFERSYLTAFVPMVFMALLLIGLGHFFAQAIAEILGYSDKAYYVRYFSWIIALDVMLLLPFAKMRLQSKPKTFVFYKVLNILLTIVLVMFFLELTPRLDIQWLQHLGIEPYTDDISYVFLSNLIASAVLFVLFLFRYRPTEWLPDKALLRRMVAYGWPLVIVGVAGSINQFFGVPLQKWFLGENFEQNMDQAALYGAAQKIPALLAIFTTAYNYAAEPFFFKNSEADESRKLYGDVTLFFIIAAGLLSVGLLYSMDIVQYIIGSNFREGLSIVPILLMAYLFLGVYYNVSIWYKLSDKTHFGAIIALIGMLITLFGNILLLSIMGVAASAWVALLCYSAMVTIAYVLGQRYFRIQYQTGAICMQLLFIGILLFIAPYILQFTALINILIGVVISLMYIGVSLYMHRKKCREYGLLK